MAVIKSFKSRSYHLLPLGTFIWFNMNSYLSSLEPIYLTVLNLISKIYDYLYSVYSQCVICISAKAIMQTFPCGHRVVCRKCFVKTIQVAVSQRLLPLRCVVCRAKILRLKQTTHGGIDTGTVLRSRAGHNASSANNAFYISPTISPVSPVTEVFREQRTVWVRNYESFELGSPPNTSLPSTPTAPKTPEVLHFNLCLIPKYECILRFTITWST